MYPEANIWLTGHSLGGGIAALTGATFGAPVVAFESPGDRMAARRLHLPSPVGLVVANFDDELNEHVISHLCCI